MFLFLFVAGCSSAQMNRDPAAMEIITSDIDNFWNAFEAAKPEFNPEVFQKLYLDPGSKGVEGFMDNRIRNAEHLAKVVKSHEKYFASLKPSTDSILQFKNEIAESVKNMKELYPDAVFPPVYFVIGAMNSGGTTSRQGLIIGAEMHGLRPDTPKEELNDWLVTVIKPMSHVPHIVAHELIHYQQKYRSRTLLEQSIKEGSADLLAELISGKHINKFAHTFANPREKELFKEFKEKMDGKDFTGWLYSSMEGRPNDLGYWMGYKISKSYYDQIPDKKQAIHDILTIRDFHEFLERSRYAQKFN